MKLSEIELDFLYEKSAELFRDKVKQRGEDYEHDNRLHHINPLLIISRY